jgi:hypothetical protein
VDRGADPADLVGDRPLVGVETEPGLAARDPQCLVGPQPARRTGRLGVRRELLARDQLVPGGGTVGQGELRGHLDDLDAGHEPHPVEEHQRPGRPRLGGRGERPAVVDAGEGMLHVPLRAEDQGLGPHPRREVEEVLRRQVVQPLQPVRPRDAQDVVVGQVHEALTRLQRVLLAVQRAVVARDRRIDAGATHGTRQPEQWRAHGVCSPQVPKIVRCPTSIVKP